MHEYERILGWLAKRRRILAVTHERPDGDALGSMFGLRSYAREAGINVLCYVAEPVPATYRTFGPDDLLSGTTIDPEEYDGILCLDCANEDRLALPPRINIENVQISVCNVDHHVDNTQYGDLVLVDPKAAATAEILCQTLRRGARPVSAEAATSLLLGLVMDTGGFRFNNTSTESMDCATWLMSQGADHSRVMHEMFFNEPIQLLRLKSKVIENLKFACNDRLVYFFLTGDLLDSCGVRAEDTEDLIDFVRVVRGADITCRMQPDDGKVRFSLRSQNPDFPVIDIAHRFGGGGHMLAAGATAENVNLAEAEALLIQYASEVLIPDNNEQ